MAQMMNRFTRKQAGVIFAATKRGDLSMEKDAVNYMYRLTEGGIDFNGAANSDIQSFRIAVDAIFENNYAEAQKNIDAIFA